MVSVYIKLFHGRQSPDEELDDWGFEGPVLGPFPYSHITYGYHLKFGAGLEIGSVFIEELFLRDELLECFGSLYGDFSVFDEAALKDSPSDLKQWEQTNKVLQTPDKLLPTLINEGAWIKNYVEHKCKSKSSGRKKGRR